MSAAKLATYVHVADDNDRMHVFGPDDQVPAWAVPKITNPGAWAGGEVPKAEDPADEIARLQARLAELSAAGSPGEAPEDDYDDKTVAELQAELNGRDLPTTGKKAELVERLREDDAREPNDE